MAITTDTVTLPGYTILTDSITGGIAVIPTIPEDSTSAQYYIVNEIADKLTIIATQLESISNSLNNGSTPVGSILSDLAQASENSARALENSAESLAGIYDRATGVGIHMKGPLDWLGLVSTYKLYVENVGPENVTLQGLIEYKAKIDALPKEF